MDKISTSELKSLAIALRGARWQKTAQGMYEADNNGWHIALVFDDDKGYGSATNLNLGVTVQIPEWIVDMVIERMQRLN